MRGSRRILMLLTVLLSTLLFAAACGDSDDEATAGDEETTTTAADDGSTTTAADDEATTTGAAGESTTTRRRRAPNRPRCGSATSPTSPTRRRSSASRRASSPPRWATTSSSSRDLQRRPRGHRGAVRRGARRHLHRPEPGDQRLRPVRRRGDPHRLRHHLGRCVPGRPRGHRRARRPRGTALATPQLGNTQDVALRAWLKEQGFETDTAGGGDVEVRPAGERRHAHRLPATATSTAPGCPSRGPPASSTRAAARCSSTRRDLWPEGQFVTTHLIVAHRVPRASTPTSSGPHRGPGSTRSTSSTATPTRPRRSPTPASRRSPTSRSPPETIDGAWENLDVHRRPDRVVAREVGGGRRRRSACSSRSTSTGIYDLTILNEVLAERGEPEVAGL